MHREVHLAPEPGPVAWRASQRLPYRRGMNEKRTRSNEAAASSDSLAQYLREIGILLSVRAHRPH